jgi:hypothetical protein
MPNPWILLGATFAVLAMIVGSYLRGDAVGSHRVQAAWDVQHALEQRDAATMQAAAEKRTHEADLRAAEAAATGEAQHAKDLETINAGAAAFGVRLAAARSGRCNSLPLAPPNPGQPAEPAARSDGGYRGDDPANSLRAVAMKLQSDVKECVNYMQQVGR